MTELTRAYEAAVAGAFRNTSAPSSARHHTSQRTDERWSSSGQVVLVAGVMGCAGASSVAVAVGEHAPSARLVECCSASASGLAAASAAELGIDDDGWLVGDRAGLRIERRCDQVPGLESLPCPAGSERLWTFLDCSLGVEALLDCGGWLASVAQRAPVVLVTRATVPGVRRLEVALGVVDSARSVVAVVGAGRRWPRLVEQACGPMARRVRAEGRVVGVPFDAALAVGGLSPDPLPAAVRAAGSKLFNIVKGLC